MRVLVSDGSYKHSLGIVRDLGRRGIEVFTCSDVRPAIAGLSKYARGHFLVPSTDERLYINVIEQIIQELHIDVYIPVGYNSCRAAAYSRERLQTICKLFISNAETIQLAADKQRTCAIAVELGIPVPRTFAPTSIEEAISYSYDASFPLVIKSKHEGAPFKTIYVHNASQYKQHYNNLLRKYSFSVKSLPIVQNCLRGGGYGFFAFYLNGIMQAYFMHRRIREYPITGGSSTCAESFADSRLFELGKRILDHLQWHGAAMVEFKQDRQGDEYYLLEINPKLWGSIDLALHCGVSFPFMMIQAACGEQISFNKDYPVGVRYHWPLSGEWKGILRRPSRFFGVMRDSLDPKVGSNVWLSDLKPNLAELLQTYMPAFVKRMIRTRV